MSEIGDIMEYNEEIAKSNKKKRNAKELYYKYRESHIKATQKWKEKNQDKYIGKLKEEYANQLQQKENIIKEVREYANTDKNCIPKHIKDYINNLLDKEKI